MSGQSFILGNSDVFVIDDAIEYAQKNGGATYIPMVDSRDDSLLFVNQDKMRDGYMVSVAGEGWGVLPDELTASKIEEYVNRKFIPYRDAFPSSPSMAPFFGLWRSEGQFWYLDVSLYVKDKAYAVHMARTTGELAIWDNAAGVALSMVE